MVNKRLILENNISLSKRSLQRFLKSEKYSINVARKKPFLNKDKARKRLLFAEKQKRNIRNIILNKIIFSDESAIQRGHGSRGEYVRKKGKKRTGREQVSSSLRSTFKNILKL